jgi:hypothetical protein
MCLILSLSISFISFKQAGALVAKYGSIEKALVKTFPEIKEKLQSITCFRFILDTNFFSSSIRVAVGEERWLLGG